MISIAFREMEQSGDVSRCLASFLGRNGGDLLFGPLFIAVSEEVG